jgi:hypothetical protein
MRNGYLKKNPQHYLGMIIRSARNLDSNHLNTASEDHSIILKMEGREGCGRFGVEYWG